jgi:hypothetical protein
MFRWVRRAVLAIVLVVLIGAVIIALTARSDLQSSRSDVNDRWRALRPALVDRYRTLATANDAVRAAGGPERDLVGTIDRALAAWTQDANAAVTTQVDDANALEAAGRRLVVTVNASSRLKAMTNVMRPVNAFAKATMPEQARSFNGAVRDFEDARGGSVRRPIAGLMGYDAIPSLDVTTA